MSEPADRREAIRAWWDKGDADLRSARILLAADPSLTDVVCFHSQQAAEKYFKSFLVHHGVGPPCTHSLTILLSLCVPYDASPNVFFEQGEALSPFAVYVRYPTLEEPAGVPTATSALRAAEAICEAVRSRLSGAGTG